MQAMCACPSNPDATRFGVPWGFGHGLGGCEPALLWLPSLSSSLTCLPPLPAVAFPLLLPPYSPPYFLFTLAGAGRSGSGCELISPSPWQGCGCGAGRRGHPFLLCPVAPHSHPHPPPRAQVASTPGYLSLGCSLSLPLQQGRECGEPTEPPCTPGLSTAAGWRKC